MVATLTALNTLRRNYTAVLSRLGFRRTRPTSTAVAIPTGQCSACGEIVAEADLCSFELDGRPVRVCKACCSYCTGKLGRAR